MVYLCSYSSFNSSIVNANYCSLTIRSFSLIWASMRLSLGSISLIPKEVLLTSSRSNTLSYWFSWVTCWRRTVISYSLLVFYVDIISVFFFKTSDYKISSYSCLALKKFYLLWIYFSSSSTSSALFPLTSSSRFKCIYFSSWTTDLILSSNAAFLTSTLVN